MRHTDQWPTNAAKADTGTVHFRQCCWITSNTRELRESGNVGFEMMTDMINPVGFWAKNKDSHLWS